MRHLWILPALAALGFLVPNASAQKVNLNARTPTLKGDRPGLNEPGKVPNFPSFRDQIFKAKNPSSLKLTNPRITRPSQDLNPQPIPPSNGLKKQSAPSFLNEGNFVLTGAIKWRPDIMRPEPIEGIFQISALVAGPGGPARISGPNKTQVGSVETYLATSGAYTEYRFRIVNVPYDQEIELQIADRGAWFPWNGSRPLATELRGKKTTLVHRGYPSYPMNFEVISRGPAQPSTIK